MYYIHMKQEGEGCDYTIGCGSKLIPLSKYGTENEQQEICSILENYVSEENPLVECMILEKVQDLMNNVDGIKLKKLDLKKEEERQITLKEIEKLKRKLEDI